MHDYIQQLIEDLGNLAANPPTPPYIEPPPNTEDYPALVELALTPYRAISDWVSLNYEVFPEVVNLTADQMDGVNRAIFKVFESLNIELIDAPENLPPEILYIALTTNWDTPVQYLPLAGYDLELCTGDSDTCPYGEYCDCGNEENPYLDDDLTSIRYDEEMDEGLPF